MPWLLEHTRKFPQFERYRLAKRIEDAAFDFHAHLVYAAVSEQPLDNLKRADIELTKLRTYLRLSVEMRYTSPSQIAFATAYLKEIGQLLGGWLKKA